MDYFIIFILFAAALFFAGKYRMLKNQLKSICTQLKDGHTRLVSVELLDKDIEAVAFEINRLLENIQQTVIKSNASAAALKSSIADISHDMKTPLTSVIGYLQLAKKGGCDEKTEEIINICLERAVSCNALINDFFELSLFEAQGCKVLLEKVDAAGIICEQILMNYPAFEKKGITPHFENSDQAVMVIADSGLLNRVIQNLISNGVRYTQGDIFFSICKENGRALITVRNPVPPHAQIDVSHIFERYYTQDKSRSRGSGIGLFLCRQFVEAMGGSICAQAEEGSIWIQVGLKLCDDKYPVDK